MSTDEYSHTMKDYPEDERPRERLIRQGASTLSTAELMAIIIRTGTKTHTAVSLSHEILAYFGGLSNLVHSSPAELQKIKGIGMAKAAQILAAIELSLRLQMAARELPSLKSPQDMARVLLPRLSYLKQEVFEVVLFDSKSRIISIPRISMGTLNRSLVHPREVFRPAIKNSAASIILTHNHPSGDPTPSLEDISVTKRLVEAGKIIGIEVLDHIIIGAGTYVSLKGERFF